MARHAVLSPKRLTSRSKRSNRRFGVAVAELAVCLPLLAVILLATVEACVMLQLKQNLAVAAYEGTRIGIIPGASASSVQLQCQMLLDDRSINGSTITLNPPDPASLDVGELFIVTIAADCTANSLFGGVFYESKQISESVVMRAE